MGQISENELLQLKLSALNAKAALTEAESDVMPRIPVIAQDLAPEPLASKPSRYRGKAPKRAKPYIRLGASNVEI